MFIRIVRSLGICVLGIALCFLFMRSSEATGPIKEFPLPLSSSEPTDIAPGADGNMWFTEQGYVQVGKIKPNGKIQEYSEGLTGNTLNGIHLGADGNMWFTEIFGGSIASVDPKGTIEQVGGFSSAYFVTPGVDGNLWVTDNGSNSIVKLTPDGQTTSYTIPTLDSGLVGITNGPDGNIWFGEQAANKIGKITLDGDITEYAIGLSANSVPNLFTAGPDGNVWFTEFAGNRIGKITPLGEITEYAKGIDKNASPVGIVAGADGSLWFTEFDKNRIGKITTNGKVTSYAVPSPQSGPNVINTDFRGNLWFTEYKGNAIGRFTLCNGELGAPKPLAPHGITLDTKRPVLFWIPGMCATSYQVIIRKNSPSNPDLIHVSNIHGLLLQTKTLKKPALYYWQVQACNAQKCIASDWNTFRIRHF